MPKPSTNLKSSRSSKRQHRGPRKGNKPKKEPVRVGGRSETVDADRFLPIFPNMCTKKLRYSETVNLSAVSGVLSSLVYTMSGLYDPNISGTGHQPMGFDQIMMFYEHYHVLHCRAKVIFRNTNATVAGFCALKVAPDTAAPASYNDLIEEGRSSHDFVNTAGGYGCWKMMTASANVPAVNGLTKANYLANEDLRGGVTFNPAEQTYLHICAYSPSVETVNFQVSIVLEYTATFTEARLLTASLPRRRPVDDVKVDDSFGFERLSFGDKKDLHVGFGSCQR